MHEYMRETSSWRYDVCKGCDYRTSFTCVRCAYCWSCHWKKERLERNELLRINLLPNVKQRIASDIPSSNNFTSEVSRLKQEKIEVVGQPSSPMKAIINVFGEEEPDPICNFLNCNHAFSLQKGNSNHCKSAACSCRHPQNSIIGLKK
jgi:hypothetical protein